jgi:biotin carboxylase
VPAKRLIVLGASRYYLRSIEAARAAGYHVIAVDRDPGSAAFAAADASAVCDIVDQEGVLAIARANRIDGVVPVNDYGVPTAAFVAGALGLPGISAESALWATDKAAMRERWIRCGVPCPAVAIATTCAEFERAVDEVGFPCILKPAHGIGGASRGVVMVHDRGELATAIAFSQSFYADKTTLVEQFVIAEAEHSAEVIVHDGVPHVVAISDKRKSRLPYRVDKSVIYPTAIAPARRESLVRTIERAVLALDISVGAAHVELATTRDGFMLFELGARCGGGGTPELVRYSTGVDEFAEVARVLAGDAPLQLAASINRGCVYQFLTPEPGVVRAVHGVEEVRSMPDILDVEVFARPGESIRPLSIGLDRAGFIIAGGSTRNAAVELAHRAESMIWFEYAV